MPVKVCMAVLLHCLSCPRTQCPKDVIKVATSNITLQVRISSGRTSLVPIEEPANIVHYAKLFKLLFVLVCVVEQCKLKLPELSTIPRYKYSISTPPDRTDTRLSNSSSRGSIVSRYCKVSSYASNHNILVEIANTCCCRTDRVVLLYVESALGALMTE